MAEITHTIPSGSRVVVVVSTGPLNDECLARMEAENHKMPDVLGKSQGVALEELSEAGFKPRVIYDYNDDITKGSVMDQHPPVGKLTLPELESLLLISSGPSINERVQVNLPDVIGLDAEEAESRLKDAGLSPQIVHYKSSTVEKGKVSAQIPDTASLVAVPERKSKVIWIIIAIILVALAALGYFAFERLNVAPPPPVEQVVSQVVVPDLIGLTEEQARVELAKVSLQLGQVTTASEEDTPPGKVPGTVMTATPAAGEEVLEGSPIALILAGEEGTGVGDTIIVPDAAGMSEDEVIATFEDVNLTVSIVRSPDLDIAENDVILQSPAPGAEVAPESVVVVVLSTGEPLEPVEVALEDVLGQPVSDATEALQGAGLVVTIPVGNEMAAGVVASQIPKPGIDVLVGSVVILEVKATQ